MTKKIERLPGSKKHTMKEKLIDKLRSKYPRMERSFQDFEPIPPDEEKYCSI